MDNCCLNMNQPRIWFTEKEAGRILGVTGKTLDFWREAGYLKPGTHWRSSFDAVQIPWNPKVIYHIRCCSDLIQECNDNDAPDQDLVA